MCKAWEDMRKETDAKAVERTLLQNLRNIMETLHLSLDQAMKALKVPEANQAELAAKLNSSK